MTEVLAVLTKLTNQKITFMYRFDADCFPLDSDIGEETSTTDSGGGRGTRDGSLKSSKKPRKARTAFTDQQLNCLEKSFERQKYLSVQDRMELATRLSLSDTQVKTWYQNRRYTFRNQIVSFSFTSQFSARTKWKRQASVSFEYLEQQGSIAAVHRLLQHHHHHAATGVGNPHPALWYSPYVASAADALFALQKRSLLEMTKSNSESSSSTLISPNKSV